MMQHNDYGGKVYHVKFSTCQHFTTVLDSLLITSSVKFQSNNESKMFFIASYHVHSETPPI